MKVFKIRASACGQIMTEAKGAITENQLKEIDFLEAKEKLTDKQKEKLQGLIYKKNNPELSETAKTYCKSWVKSQVYNRRLEFTSKYTEKGLIMEDSAIEFISKQLNTGLLFKSEEQLENEFMTGCTDISIKDYDFDAKNSWSWETFPLLEDEIPDKYYYYQGQVYMCLTGKKHYKLIYCLSDTPIHLIEREARNYCFYNGYGEMDMEIYNEFHRKLTYQDIPDKLKIKIFEFDRDESVIEKIKERVLMCRKYIDDLNKKIK